MFHPIYCPLAINIYDSCPHGCTYCYARSMAERFGKPWGSVTSARPGIVEAVRKQLTGMRGQGQKIMLCFTCDPYPMGCDTTATREIIKAIKESGNHVQILTKGDSESKRDFDLLDHNDSFGITFSGGEDVDEPGAATSYERFCNLLAAKDAGISTWVSCEPVLNPHAVIDCIKEITCQYPNAVGLWRIGKLNHRKNDINWKRFGLYVEDVCQRLGVEYYIKEDLRMAMEHKEAK